MDTMEICSGCQKPLAPNAPQGLCPECLIKAGLGTGVDIGPDSQAQGAQIRFVAPTPEELAKPFPQLEILGFIGQGGMGAVYRARQKALDRIVALKILPPGIGKDPAFAARFTREAKALGKLNHPGIVTLYEFGQADGLFFFLMEFVDGVNLRHLLEAGRVSPREALAIVPQICDALQYAHDQGIVHRDIKPENILLDRQGRVKVADFGLAKLVGTEALTPALSHPMGEGGASAPGEGTPSPAALTDAGKVMGTPQYMAPEQREHPTEVDHRADIYSLGVVFYQMLTGELPGKPIEAPSHKVRIDVRLDEVVLRALEKEPARRYQQVSQVRTAVETIAATPPAISSGREPAPTHSAGGLGSQHSVGAAPPPASQDRFWRRFALALAAVVLAPILILVGVALVGMILGVLSGARRQNQQVESSVTASTNAAPAVAPQTLTFGPVIERVVVSTDQATITGRSPDAGMSIMIGVLTNNDVWIAPHNGSPFSVTLESGWFERRYHWVVKAAFGNVTYRLDSKTGPMTGRIVFRPGKPAPEADGSYVIGEFKSETGATLPMAVRLVRESKPSASPATAKTWSPALAAGEKPDLQKIRNEADSLMNQGRYEEALQRHIWYFKHALENGEVNPVRLSFGLTGWGELARRYPQARQSLIQVRDRDAQVFSTGGGSFDLFQEAANINRELRDDDATVALFKNIQTDSALARRCYFVAEDLLVRKGEYALCSNYIGDPQPRFQTICTSRDMEKKIDPAGKADNRFVVSTRQLIEILISAGRKTEAERIRDEAVSLLDDARLKSAVSDAEEKVRQMLRQGETNKKLPAQPQSAPNAPMLSPAASASAQKLSFGPVTNGLQAAVELTTSNGVVRLGELIAVRFHIRNASDHQIIVAGSAYRQGDQCILEDEQGHRVEVSLSEREIITFTQRLLLGPGEGMVFESGGFSFQSEKEAKFSYLASYYAKAKPGRYTLRFRLHLPDAGLPDKRGLGDWQGDLETAPIVVDVNNPATPAPAVKPSTK